MFASDEGNLWQWLDMASCLSSAISCWNDYHSWK